MTPIQFIYDIAWKTGKNLQYNLTLNPEDLSLVLSEDTNLPEWTKLEFEQCINCPLKKEQSPHCPVAVGIHFLFEVFKNETSFVQVFVQVTSNERKYTKEVPLQVAIQSIFGIIFPTSGCPRTKFLRPMARFHLPFSSVEETLIRSTSFNLLSQYMESKAGKEVTWNLNELNENYKQLSQTNSDIARRITKAREMIGSSRSGDATSNAIIILDIFAQALPFEIDDELLSLKYLFQK